MWVIKIDDIWHGTPPDEQVTWQWKTWFNKMLNTPSSGNLSGRNEDVSIEPVRDKGSIKAVVR